MNRRAVAASQGADRAQLWHIAGPADEGAAPGCCAHIGGSQPVSGIEFLPDWDQRFAVKAAIEVDAHRPLGEVLKLESTLSWVEERQVTNDCTVSWEAQRWQIPKAAVRPGLRGSKLRIEARLDGSLQARIDDRFVSLTICKKVEKQSAQSKRPTRRYVPPSGQSRWMDHFSV